MQIQFPLLPKPICWFGVVLIAGFIFYNSILAVPPQTPIDDAQPWFVPLSSWRHLLAYATLAYALAYAMEHWEGDPWNTAGLVIGVVFLYGVGIEFGQYFVPDRHADASDVLVNGIGASTVLLWYAIHPYFELRPVADLLGRDHT